MLICFEGVDGSGKTTVSKVLATELEALWCRTPGEGKVGKRIRKILLDKEDKVHPEALPFLFLGDMIHCHNEIKIINNNHKVIVDRWKMSTLIYQVEREWFTVKQKNLLKKMINEWIPDPDLLIVLDINFKRYAGGDRFEDEPGEFERRRKLYKKYYKNYKGQKKFLDVTNLPLKQVVLECKTFIMGNR